MPLSAGTRLGPYEVLGPLGAGGMGEVYRATDTRLDRTVAIKILPSHLSGNSDLKQRFEREARAISKLIHPHICGLFDVGSQDGTEFLVMELLEGETLAQRLKKGALPIEQMLRFGIQIAEALDKAHRMGIIHRDLKPGNIMLTKTGVKLLDFGLAKLDGELMKQSGEELSSLRTEAKDLTAEGTILGTVQYMSPEQLEGKNVDERSDIFALGDVLYEMATGQTAFSGKSKASLISAILKDDPLRVSQVQPMSPAALDHVVKKCLAKDPEERWHNSYDVASELKWIAESSSTDIASPSARKRLKMSQKLWMGISGALLLAFIIVSLQYIKRPSVPESQVVRFTIPAPKNSAFQGGIAVSPDGKKLAFVAIDESGVTSLWIRQLDSTQGQRVPETDDASLPFWSPDSRIVGYFSHGKMRKINPFGGTSQVICDASDGRGASWGPNGIILFSPNANEGLYRVSSEGGDAEPVAEQSGGSRRWPETLPDGKHFLYVHTTGTTDAVGIYVGSLDSKESRKLLNIVSRVLYVSPGYLIYIDQGSLVCRPFDTNKLEIKGDPFPIASQPWLDFYIFGSSGFSLSRNGVLAYRDGGNQQGQFTWYDRSGKKLSTVGPPCGANEPFFSFDEKHILFYQFQNVVGLDDEWLLDLTTGKLSRFTFDPADDNTSAWSPDGSRIVWASVRTGEYELYQKASSGAGVDEPLLINHVPKFPDGFSPDGKFLIYDQEAPKSLDIWILPMTGEKKPFPYLQTPANEGHARFSPDGKWIAYSSDESGKSEIYVEGFPTAKTGKWQISNAGGDQVQWRRDGKELFYAAPDGSIMSVEIRSTESDFSSGTPTFLFRLMTHSVGITSSRNDYLVTGDGQRFLVNTPLEDTTKLPITVVLNWKNLLKQ